jgi:hypothetical protein
MNRSDTDGCTQIRIQIIFYLDSESDTIVLNIPDIDIHPIHILYIPLNFLNTDIKYPVTYTVYSI